MKKVSAILLCLVLAVSLAACGTDDAALKARYDEGYKAGAEDGKKAGAEEGMKAGYEEGRKAGYEEGYAAGKQDGLKEGSSSGTSGRKYARFSGSFTASVGTLIPDYYALPGNSVAVVHFFQDGPFLLRFNEDMTGKLTEGLAYVFEFQTFEVQIPDDVQYPDIKDYMNYISVTGFRLAEEGEMGLQSKTPDVETAVK
ncbi:MAG: hypothetical protein II164_07050 [Firmicutes bacterium]|nr:hypothetical protein [Bacillota bacterium]